MRDGKGTPFQYFGVGDFIFMFRFADITAAEAKASACLLDANALPTIQTLDESDRVEAAPLADVSGLGASVPPRRRGRLRRR